MNIFHVLKRMILYQSVVSNLFAKSIEKLRLGFDIEKTTKTKMHKYCAQYLKMIIPPAAISIPQQNVS